MIKDKCIICGEPKSGLKYCNNCKPIAKRIANYRFAVNRQFDNLKLCADCNEVYTRFKYCKECSQKVHRPTLKISKVRKCIKCHKTFRSKHSRYCKSCLFNKKEEAQRIREEAMVIDPMYLIRGTISEYSWEY